MSGNQTFLDPPDGPAGDKEKREGSKAFTFDRSFWSAGDKDDPSYASQQTLFDYLGKDILDHAFGGFNATLFAYGQTGLRPFCIRVVINNQLTSITCHSPRLWQILQYDGLWCRKRYHSSNL